VLLNEHENTKYTFINLFLIHQDQSHQTGVIFGKAVFFVTALANITQICSIFASADNESIDFVITKKKSSFDLIGEIDKSRFFR
jgi:hypothetical protein